MAKRRDDQEPRKEPEFEGFLDFPPSEAEPSPADPPPADVELGDVFELDTDKIQ